MQRLFPGNTFVAPKVAKGLRLAIGEAPGATEAEQGQPFVGGSGRWLDVFYRKAGVNRERDVSAINCIQCRPEDNKFPTDSTARSYITEADAHQAVKQCLTNHVEPFLKSRPWERIDTFGDKPLKFILEKNGGVTNWRGSILPVPLLGPSRLAVPTFHPAYIARDQSMIPVAINDLRKTLELEPEFYTIQPTLDQVKAFRFKRFAFDIETLPWRNNEITMVGLSAEPFKALVVPFTGEYIPELKRIFAEAAEVIGQNCFARDTSILMADGSYKPIWQIKEGDYVKSLAYGQVVNCQVEALFQTVDDRPWVDVRVDGAYNKGVGRWGNSGVVCTPDHEWITPSGKVRADKLRQGDKLLLPRLGSDSLIQGTLLGDGHCSKDGYLSLVHTNKVWAELKAHHLGVKTREYTIRGFKETTGWSLRTRVPRRWRNMYSASGEKLWEAPFDNKALAVWYCDDGCLHKSKVPSLSIHCFRGQEARILSWAIREFGAGCSIWKTGSLSWHTKEAKEFFSRIAPYVPPCMEYKLPEEFRGQYAGWLEQLVPQTGYVESVKPVSRKKSRGKYCLTVKDTHTFFTRAGLTANCVQFDLPILKNNGITIKGPEDCRVWDIMLLHHLRFPVFPHDLEFIGKQFTNKGAWKADKQIFEIYCARDVDVTFRCFGPLKELVEQAGLLDTYQYISWPIAMICKLMTDTGVKVSSERLKELRHDYFGKITSLEEELPAELRSYSVRKRKRVPAPEGTVNKLGKPLKYVFEEYDDTVTPWRSTAAKLKYLYETLKLPKQLHIKSKKPTADKGALDKLYFRFKLPELKTLREISKYATLLQSFAKEELEGASSFLHPSFNVHGTCTGRLSSSGPNIQNQPGKVRFMYVSRFDGGSIVAADFSGIENRITSYLARDRRRSERLADKNFSEHKYLVSSFYNIPYDLVEKSHDKDSPYAICKIICHGTDRCMGADKISKQFDLELDTVKKLQFAWKSEIRDTIAWQKRVMAEAVRTGVVTNPFGRKLWIWTSGSGPEAVSFFPQSSAADVIFRAMLGLYYDRIGWPLSWVKRVCPVVDPLPAGTKLFIQVHDELVVDSPSESVEIVRTKLRNVMSQAWAALAGMILPVSIEQGPSWGDCG